ncbi:heme NO-binding domain-containing protein [Sulfitobacter sp. S190]|uniref:heme NO-binding domain-containing protein n=1 Tax=Sulfitobacter sp. S190 TaxID=2867022 RepID=UPI0021A349E4|nr:heme NO-binding domain-containing protein [Sulfitobacter sp. S190]UWR23506.1 heme NO-binding domain-containing protein [Sulfitobacter sp. S190]
MHGLINRSIQNYICDGYGADRWLAVARRVPLDPPVFEAMLWYEDALTHAALDAAAEVLERDRSEVMEDIGSYLVSHPNAERVRRLLRFGGATFEDFLHSLDDLPDRARLAVPDLVLPGIELLTEGAGRYVLRCGATFEGFGHFMMGLLRAMSDDYGTLALLEHVTRAGGDEVVEIGLIEAEFSTGRLFELGQSV